MSRLNLFQLPLSNLKLVQRKALKDSRGFLSRIFCAEELSAAGFSKPIIQINHTHTIKKGTVRGLHFQYPPHAETKLVSCLKGEVFDVVVDLRADSPSFLNWHGEILSAENFKSLLIPEGFAHGFQALSDDCEMIYLHTEAYRHEAEGALNVADPRLDIAWPLPFQDLSDRDKNHQFIGMEYSGVVL